MENSWLIPLIFCFSIPILILLRSLGKNRKLKLPPGPPKLPIIGNVHQLIANPHDRLLDLVAKYGPIMHLQLGEVHTIVISSAELAKLVMRTHDANFANRPSLIVSKYVYYNNSDMGLAPTGEYWRQIRKIATAELLTTKRVQSFRDLREQETKKLVKTIASEAANGRLINLNERVFSMLFDITSKMVFNSILKEQKEFGAVIMWLLETPPGFTIGDLYPSIKLLHKVSGLKKMREMVAESDRILDPVIEHHQANLKREKVDQEPLIDVLLRFHRDFPHDSDFSLTNDRIKAIILELFVAGTESSLTTIEWAMAELIKNPKDMEKAQKEVRGVFKGKGSVDESGLDQLKFMKLVIKETFRLHPVAPFLVPRESIDDFKIGGYDIPAKSRVMVNARTIGRDPKYWSDPDKFIPERFEDSKIDYKGNNFEFLPFGSGRRMCPGMALGIANLELPLAMLLYHFDWKSPGGAKDEDLNMDESFGVTVKKKNELEVVPVFHV